MVVDSSLVTQFKKDARCKNYPLLLLLIFPNTSSMSISNCLIILDKSASKTLMIKFFSENEV